MIRKKCISINFDKSLITDKLVINFLLKKNEIFLKENPSKKKNENQPYAISFFKFYFSFHIYYFLNLCKKLIILNKKYFKQDIKIHLKKIHLLKDCLKWKEVGEKTNSHVHMVSFVVIYFVRSNFLVSFTRRH